MVLSNGIFFDAYIESTFSAVAITPAVRLYCLCLRYATVVPRPALLPGGQGEMVASARAGSSGALHPQEKNKLPAETGGGVGVPRAGWKLQDRSGTRGNTL